MKEQRLRLSLIRIAIGTSIFYIKMLTIIPASQLFTKSVIVVILSPDSQNFQFRGEKMLFKIWELLLRTQIK